MAKKNGAAVRKVSQVVTFGKLKNGEKFSLTGRREGTRGRKPIFTKTGPRAYETRLGEKVTTRAMNTEVRRVGR